LLLRYTGSARRLTGHKDGWAISCPVVLRATPSIKREAGLHGKASKLNGIVLGLGLTEHYPYPIQ